MNLQNNYSPVPPSMPSVGAVRARANDGAKTASRKRACHGDGIHDQGRGAGIVVDDDGSASETSSPPASLLADTSDFDQRNAPMNMLSTANALREKVAEMREEMNVKLDTADLKLGRNAGKIGDLHRDVDRTMNLQYNYSPVPPSMPSVGAVPARAKMSVMGLRRKYVTALAHEHGADTFKTVDEFLGRNEALAERLRKTFSKGVIDKGNLLRAAGIRDFIKKVARNEYVIINHPVLSEEGKQLAAKAAMVAAPCKGGEAACGNHARPGAAAAAVPRRQVQRPAKRADRGLVCPVPRRHFRRHTRRQQQQLLRAMPCRLHVLDRVHCPGRVPCRHIL